MKVKLLHPNAKMPTRAYEGDLGFDFYALEDVYVPAVSEGGGVAIVKVRTGIAVELPPGFGAFIKDRSSVATQKGLHTIAGVIDNGYRGEIIIALANLSCKFQTIKAGEKIAQLVPIHYYNYPVTQTEELSETIRNHKGFGSSNKKEV